MSLVGLLVGGKSLGYAGFTFMIMMFAIGAMTGANAAATDSVAVEQRHTELHEAMDGVSANLSEDGSDSQFGQEIKRSAIDPVLTIGTEAFDSGLWLGYFNPLIGEAAAYLSGLGGLLMTISPMLGGRI